MLDPEKGVFHGRALADDFIIMVIEFDFSPETNVFTLRLVLYVLDLNDQLLAVSRDTGFKVSFAEG